MDSNRTYVRPNPAQKMYAYAMPRQYTMLVDCPYVIVPLFKCARLNAEWVSKLNPLTTAWCVAENIMLAVINEGLGYSLRIPLNREHDVVLQTLGVPQGTVKTRLMKARARLSVLLREDWEEGEQ